MTTAAERGDPLQRIARTIRENLDEFASLLTLEQASRCLRLVQG